MRMLICSDSSAALASLKHFSSKYRKDILNDILQTLLRIIRLGIDVLCLWVPAHIGIRGNEAVDVLAKNALNANHVEVSIPVSKAKAFVWNKIILQRQKLWDADNKGQH